MVDALREALEDANEFSAVTSEFSIFAFDALRRSLQSVGSTKLLLTSNSQPEEGAEDTLSLLGNAAERALRNNLNAAAVAKACAEWIERTVEVRRATTPVPFTLYATGNNGKEACVIQGSSPFSASGLGIVPSPRLEMNSLFTDGEQVQSLRSYFDSLWSDTRIAQPAKKDVLDRLAQVYEPRSAQQIYLAILYALFQDNLGQLTEDDIVRTKTGIKDTLVWRKLYRFQRDGVLGAIDKIERYNGCIIADSVGLGKTFEALAIIKYYELRNDRVLVLAPKRLRENWTLYTVNDKRNIFAPDRFNFDVLNHTDLSRTSGFSGEINLESINWGNYDLVVIDESHNFRNKPSPKKEGMTRYTRLMNEIIRAGVNTRVLMLSATPVNNRMNDLKNQVAFITGGTDTALENSGIASLEVTLRQAQARFNMWLKLEAEARTTTALLDSLNFDYFKLLDLLTIARSRKHIERYYDLSEVGAFPRRLQPINIRAEIDTAGGFPPIIDVNRDIRRMNLGAYAPLKYVRADKRPEYSRKYDIETGEGNIWRQSDREENLIHLMRVNLLKRMESSIHSFTLTMEKLLSKVQDLLDRIEQHQDGEIEELSIENIDLDSDDLDEILIGAKVKVLLQDVDRVRWSQDLEEDKEILEKLLSQGRKVSADRDEKLGELKRLISAKLDKPVNAGNRKVLVFTHFADTASYLYEHISEWAMSQHGIHTATVTGGSGKNATTLPNTRLDIQSILTAFSPVTKERSLVNDVMEEIDVLIATDCVSEGQNLQDCDFLVNYDIHWNPVRIIQRFGRVDRLGSKNDAIQLANFWPNMELDEYINLEARVSGRMVLLDISATGEENVIEVNRQGQMNDLEYRKKQLERLQQEVVDLEDLSGGISITDLTLNDFKMDLGDQLKTHETTLASLPLGAYSVVLSNDELTAGEIRPGAFFCLRSENPKAMVDSSYSLAPHFLIYISDDGSVLLDYLKTRRLLEILKKVAANSGKPDAKAFESWERLTRGGKDMSHYQSLLERAVSSVTGRAEERGVASLFQRGGTSVARESYRGLDDFEVVAYLAVIGEDGR